MTLAQRQAEAEAFREQVNLGKRLVEELIGILRQARTSVLYGETHAHICNDLYNNHALYRPCP